MSLRNCNSGADTAGQEHGKQIKTPSQDLGNQSPRENAMSGITRASYDTEALGNLLARGRAGKQSSRANFNPLGLDPTPRLGSNPGPPPAALTTGEAGDTRDRPRPTTDGPAWVRNRRHFPMYLRHAVDVVSKRKIALEYLEEQANIPEEMVQSSADVSSEHEHLNYIESGCEAVPAVEPAQSSLAISRAMRDLLYETVEDHTPTTSDIIAQGVTNHILGESASSITKSLTYAVAATAVGVAGAVAGSITNFLYENALQEAYDDLYPKQLARAQHVRSTFRTFIKPEWPADPKLQSGSAHATEAYSRALNYKHIMKFLLHRGFRPYELHKGHHKGPGFQTVNTPSDLTKTKSIDKRPVYVKYIDGPYKYYHDPDFYACDTVVLSLCDWFVDLEELMSFRKNIVIYTKDASTLTVRHEEHFITPNADGTYSTVVQGGGFYRHGFRRYDVDFISGNLHRPEPWFNPNMQSYHLPLTHNIYNVDRYPLGRDELAVFLTPCPSADRTPVQCSPAKMFQTAYTNSSGQTMHLQLVAERIYNAAWETIGFNKTLYLAYDTSDEHFTGAWNSVVQAVYTDSVTPLTFAGASHIMNLNHESHHERLKILTQIIKDNIATLEERMYISVNRGASFGAKYVPQEFEVPDHELIPVTDNWATNLLSVWSNPYKTAVRALSAVTGWASEVTNPPVHILGHHSALQNASTIVTTRSSPSSTNYTAPFKRKLDKYITINSPFIPHFDHPETLEAAPVKPLFNASTSKRDAIHKNKEYLKKFQPRLKHHHLNATKVNPLMRPIAPPLTPHFNNISAFTKSPEASADAVFTRIADVNKDAPSKQIEFIMGPMATFKQFLNLCFNQVIEELDVDQLSEHMTTAPQRRRLEEVARNHLKRAIRGSFKNSAFTKSETTDKLLAKTRNISNQNSENLILMSCFTYPAAAYFKQVCPSYLFQYNNSQVGTLNQRMHSTFDTVIEMDYSSFDGSQNFYTYMVEKIFYDHLFPNSNVLDLLDLSRNATYQASDVMRYWPTYTRLSGAAETSLSNTVINMVIQFLARVYGRDTPLTEVVPLGDDPQRMLDLFNTCVAGGDDGNAFNMDPIAMERMASAFGLSLKAVEQSTTAPINLLGAHYPAPVSSPGATINTKRVLGKLFSSCVNTNLTEREQFLAKLNGYYTTTANGNPLITDALTALISIAGTGLRKASNANDVPYTSFMKQYNPSCKITDAATYAIDPTCTQILLDISKMTSMDELESLSQLMIPWEAEVHNPTYEKAVENTFTQRSTIHQEYYDALTKQERHWLASTHTVEPIIQTVQSCLALIPSLEVIDITPGPGGIAHELSKKVKITAVYENQEEMEHYKSLPQAPKFLKNAKHKSAMKYPQKDILYIIDLPFDGNDHTKSQFATNTVIDKVISKALRGMRAPRPDPAKNIHVVVHYHKNSSLATKSPLKNVAVTAHDHNVACSLNVPIIKRYEIQSTARPFNGVEAETQNVIVTGKTLHQRPIMTVKNEFVVKDPLMRKKEHRKDGDVVYPDQEKALDLWANYNAMVKATTTAEVVALKMADLVRTPAIPIKVDTPPTPVTAQQVTDFSWVATQVNGQTELRFVPTMAAPVKDDALVLVPMQVTASVAPTAQAAPTTVAVDKSQATTDAPAPYQVKVQRPDLRKSENRTDTRKVNTRGKGPRPKRK